MDFTVALFKDPNKIHTFNFVNIYLKSLLICRYLTSLFFLLARNLLKIAGHLFSGLSQSLDSADCISVASSTMLLCLLYFLCILEDVEAWLD